MTRLFAKVQNAKRTLSYPLLYSLKASVNPLDISVK